MKERHTLVFVLAATLLSTTFLTVDVPFVNAIEWSDDSQLTTDLNQDLSPAIMQDENGTIWVVWASNRIIFLNYELFYTTSSDYGLHWSPDTRLTENSSYDTNPSIIQACDGAIWVVWSSDRTGNYELFCKTSPDNGAEWSDDTPLTTDPNRDTSPSIMQARDGLIWVVWQSNRAGNYELFYKTFNGTAWSSDMQLTTDPDLDRYPSIIQACDGAIWVVWSSDRAGNHELFYKTFNGTAWSSDMQLTEDLNIDLGPSIARARDGSIWVVWQSDRPLGKQDELFYKIYNGSIWSSDTALTDNLADDVGPSIAQIDDRRIWVVWQAQRNEDFDVYYKTSSEIIAHDVAITNVSPSAIMVNQGETVSIGVEVQNQGDTTEAFDVNCYVNETSVGSEAVALANGTSTMLVFSWNTMGTDYDNYTIRAEASIVPGEIDTADNMYSDGKVTVTMLGDVNGDFTVDDSDLILLSQVYGLTPSSPKWNPYADLNKDNIVNVSDVWLLGENYG